MPTISPARPRTDAEQRRSLAARAAASARWARHRTGDDVDRATHALAGARAAAERAELVAAGASGAARTARAEADAVEARVRALVEAAPPLSDAQRDRLAALLAPVATSSSSTVSEVAAR